MCLKIINVNPSKRLIKMYDLQQIDAGTIGTVTAVDDIGQIQMNWENGSTLALNVEVDEFEIC